MTDLTTFDDVSIEALTIAAQAAFEECENVFQLVDKKWKQLEYFGKILTAAKRKVPHGQWTQWLETTFDGRLPYRTAHRWIEESNLPHVADLRRQENRERNKRNGAGVTVVESTSQPGQTGVQADTTQSDQGGSGPTGEERQTANQSLNSGSTPGAATTQRKTAKGSKKTPEAERTPTQPVVPEIVDDPEDSVDAAESTGRIITAFVIQCEIRQFLELKRQHTGGDSEKLKKALAKELRKEADNLDPPKQSIPTVEEVATYAESRGWKTFDAEKFWNHYELAGWKYGKAKTPLTKWHTAAAQAWDDGRGWASTTSNGKANGNGSHLGDNGRPAIKKAKVTYR